MDNDRSYFIRREAEERTTAGRSKGKARKAHSDMAVRYRTLADSTEPPA